MREWLCLFFATSLLFGRVRCLGQLSYTGTSPTTTKTYATDHGHQKQVIARDMTENDLLPLPKPRPVVPTSSPSAALSLRPSSMPTVRPSATPTLRPSTVPTVIPSAVPTLKPSSAPTLMPSTVPTLMPSTVPTLRPSTLTPSTVPTLRPSTAPTPAPFIAPPTFLSSTMPTSKPFGTPPTSTPTVYVSNEDGEEDKRQYRNQRRSLEEWIQYIARLCYTEGGLLFFGSSFAVLLGAGLVAIITRQHQKVATTTAVVKPSSKASRDAARRNRFVRVRQQLSTIEEGRPLDNDYDYDDSRHLSPGADDQWFATEEEDVMMLVEESCASTDDTNVAMQRGAGVGTPCEEGGPTMMATTSGQAEVLRTGREVLRTGREVLPSTMNTYFQSGGNSGTTNDSTDEEDRNYPEESFEYAPRHRHTPYYTRIAAAGGGQTAVYGSSVVSGGPVAADIPLEEDTLQVSIPSRPVFQSWRMVDSAATVSAGSDYHSVSGVVPSNDGGERGAFHLYAHTYAPVYEQTYTHQPSGSGVPGTGTGSGGTSDPTQSSNDQQPLSSPGLRTPYSSSGSIEGSGAEGGEDGEDAILGGSSNGGIGSEDNDLNNQHAHATATVSMYGASDGMPHIHPYSMVLEMGMGMEEDDDIMVSMALAGSTSEENEDTTRLVESPAASEGSFTYDSYSPFSSSSSPSDSQQHMVDGDDVVHSNTSPSDTQQGTAGTAAADQTSYYSGGTSSEITAATRTSTGTGSEAETSDEDNHTMMMAIDQD